MNWFQELVSRSDELVSSSGELVSLVKVFRLFYIGNGLFWFWAHDNMINPKPSYFLTCKAQKVGVLPKM